MEQWTLRRPREKYSQYIFIVKEVIKDFIQLPEQFVLSKIT